VRVSVYTTCLGNLITAFSLKRFFRFILPCIAHRNGHDSLVLSKLALKEGEGTLYCIDIQQNAIIDTEKRLVAELGVKLVYERIKMFCCNHEKFPDELKEATVAAVVYNLGYLPGTHADGERRVVTSTESTNKSLNAALKLLRKGGILSATAYRGHASGIAETQMCQDFFASLDPKQWRVFAHNPINTANSPILFTAYKRHL
jgi:hypothetical protein